MPGVAECAGDAFYKPMEFSERGSPLIDSEAITDRNHFTNMSTINAESAVRERYAAGAKAAEAKLCCPVDYNPEYLKVIPQEVIERDYGCGDPSKYLREGETVLDLGSGTGKICFIAAQVVGPAERSSASI